MSDQYINVEGKRIPLSRFDEVIEVDGKRCRWNKTDECGFVSETDTVEQVEYENRYCAYLDGILFESFKTMEELNEFKKKPTISRLGYTFVIL